MCIFFIILIEELTENNGIINVILLSVMHEFWRQFPKRAVGIEDEEARSRLKTVYERTVLYLGQKIFDNL